MAKGDGIVSRGKTKCKIYPPDGDTKSTDGDVAKGHKASSVKNKDMKALGQNLARVKNQTGKGK